MLPFIEGRLRTFRRFGRSCLSFLNDAPEKAHREKADRQAVLTAVRENGMAPQFADSSLKSEMGVVLEAVRQSGDAPVLMLADQMINRRDG